MEQSFRTYVILVPSEIDSASATSRSKICARASASAAWVIVWVALSMRVSQDGEDAAACCSKTWTVAADPQATA